MRKHLSNPDLLKTVSRSVTYLPRAQPWPGLLDGCPHGPRQEVSTSPSHNSHHCCTSALPTSNFQVSTKTTSTPPCNCRTTERASNERAHHRASPRKHHTQKRPVPPETGSQTSSSYQRPHTGTPEVSNPTSFLHNIFGSAPECVLACKRCCPSGWY